MIYSIGYGNKTEQEFLEELNSFKIKILVDVRSSPYSKFNAIFNKQTLEGILHKNAIEFRFMGDQIGGLSKDKSCYRDGKVDYSILREKDNFREGIKKLIEMAGTELDLAIMCSELKPWDCHRSRLIGQELMKEKIEILHIISLGKTLTQNEVIDKITDGFGVINLFGEEITLTSEKKYK